MIKDIQPYVKKELDKCKVLCRNCHQKEHSDGFFDKHCEEIRKKTKNIKEKNKVDVDKVISLFKEDKDRKEISEILSCSSIRVYEILKAHGMYEEKKPIDVEKIIDLYKENLKIREIVDKTGYSKSTILRYTKGVTR